MRRAHGCLRALTLKYLGALVPPFSLHSGGEANSVVRSDLETDPTISNIYNRPVEQITPLPTGVSILAK